MSELQKKIVEEMNVYPEINVQEEIRKSIDFIKEYWAKNEGLKTAVLGISGGQDSTLLGKLAQMAAEEMREETGKEEYAFLAARLPYGEQADEEDLLDALEWIQPDETIHVNIKPSVDATVEALEKEGVEITDYNKGNIKARERMIVQYAIAGARSGIVLGTDHPAENITGFFTKFGDGGADILPLFRLNKRQGKELLQELGAPEHLVNKTPTADLEDDKPLESDEEALGVSYEQIDAYLEGKEVPKEAKETIEQHYLSTQHKRHLPITIFDDFWK